MKKTFFGISAFVILISGIIILAIVAMIVLFIGFEMDDDYGEEYFWGGEGNFADNEVPLQYIPLYKKAAEEYDLDWELLAAIHRVETVFSTINPMVSHVGAEGHAQFMPCTWVGWGHPTCDGLGKGNISDGDKSNPDVIAKYGGYGVDGNGDGKADMWHLEDAIFSMANYLSAGYNSTGTIDGAIFQYNHSSSYVSNVKGFMNRYKNDLVAIDHIGGQSPVVISGDRAWVVPGATTITSCFGPRWGRNHNGIDVTAGTPGKVNGYTIVAFMDGTVATSKYHSGLGNYVVIDHGGGLRSLYGHMLETGIPVGRTVRAGDRIGRVGNTGASRGAHLHFELHINGVPMNPLQNLSGFDLYFNPGGSSCPSSI